MSQTAMSTQTVGGRSFDYIGFATPSDDGCRLVLHAYNYEALRAFGPACYLITADSRPRYIGEGSGLKSRMGAYFWPIQQIGSGKVPNPPTIAVCEQYRPQERMNVQFGVELRKFLMANDLRKRRLLEIWAFEIPLDKGCDAQSTHESNKRQEIETRIQGACKDDIRFLRCRLDDTGYSGQFRQCTCSRCVYNPQSWLSRSLSRVACSCQCRLTGHIA